MGADTDSALLAEKLLDSSSGIATDDAVLVLTEEFVDVVFEALGDVEDVEDVEDVLLSVSVGSARPSESPHADTKAAATKNRGMSFTRRAE